ncbi:hypothetical protein TFLX_05478 [Thermoflexales bacterium]|nr:hypothetical protein TFLX_05478 [Thermoflexales bacterium]
MVPLNIPRLLRSIDTRRVDPEILVRCKEAQHWLRRKEIDKALELARATTRLAARARSVNKRDIATEAVRRTSAGIALLYLAYLRHLSMVPAEGGRALLTGQLALTWLAHDEYHHALAELVLARIAWEEERFEVAVRHYQAALPRLDKLMVVQHRQSNPRLEAEYQGLKQAAQQAVRRVPLADRPTPAHLSPPLEESSDRDWLDQIEIPAELIWTHIDLAGMQLMPVQSAEHNVAILSQHVQLQPDKLDYIEVDQLSIGGQHYQILAPEPTRGKFRMQTGQPYYAFQFAAAREPQPPGQPDFALVRSHDRTLPPDWPIVILIPTEQRALLVHNQPPASPLIIGERVWAFQDGTDTKTYHEDDVQIAGAVVALLTPLDSPATE